MLIILILTAGRNQQHETIAIIAGDARISKTEQTSYRAEWIY
jgi:hypothetical protein